MHNKCLSLKWIASNAWRRAIKLILWSSRCQTDLDCRAALHFIFICLLFMLWLRTNGIICSLLHANARLASRRASTWHTSDIDTTNRYVHSISNNYFASLFFPLHFLKYLPNANVSISISPGAIIIGALCDAPCVHARVWIYRGICELRRERARMTHSFDRQRRSLIDAIDGTIKWHSVHTSHCCAFLNIYNGNRDSSAHSRHPMESGGQRERDREGRVHLINKNEFFDKFSWMATPKMMINCKTHHVHIVHNCSNLWLYHKRSVSSLYYIDFPFATQ